MGGITVVTSVRGRLEDEFVEIHLREIHQKSVIYLISASSTRSVMTGITVLASHLNF